MGPDVVARSNADETVRCTRPELPVVVSAEVAGGIGGDLGLPLRLIADDGPVRTIMAGLEECNPEVSSERADTD